MFIVITLLLIIGLGCLTYTGLGLNQHKNYTFKNAKIKKQQGKLILIGLSGAFILMIAFMLIKI